MRKPENSQYIKNIIGTVKKQTNSGLFNEHMITEGTTVSASLHTLMQSKTYTFTHFLFSSKWCIWSQKVNNRTLDITKQICNPLSVCNSKQLTCMTVANVCKKLWMSQLQMLCISFCRYWHHFVWSVIQFWFHVSMQNMHLTELKYFHQICT